MTRPMSGTVASFRYVELPARQLIVGVYGADLFHTPEVYRCKKLGQIAVKMRTENKMLAVFQDEISGAVFWWQGYSSDLPRLQLKSQSHEYGDLGMPLYEITTFTVEQFCYFSMGWGVEYNHLYLKDDRLALVNSIMQAFNITEFPNANPPGATVPTE